VISGVQWCTHSPPARGTNWEGARAMGLRLTGRLFTREGKPYEIEGKTGVSYKARVGTGRAEFIDVKIPATTEALGVVPPTEHIPEEGIPVDWIVRLGFDRKGLEFVGISQGVEPPVAPESAAEKVGGRHA
jgi:hypothetical protein